MVDKEEGRGGGDCLQHVHITRRSKKRSYRLQSKKKKRVSEWHNQQKLLFDDEDVSTPLAWHSLDGGEREREREREENFSLWQWLWWKLIEVCLLTEMTRSFQTVVVCDDVLYTCELMSFLQLFFLCVFLSLSAPHMSTHTCLDISFTCCTLKNASMRQRVTHVLFPWAKNKHAFFFWP